MKQKNQYTVRATEALQQAFAGAKARGNPEATPSHLLFALLQQADGIAPKLLAKIGVSAARLEAELREALDRLPSAEGGAEPQPARSLREVLEQAAKLAPQFQDEYVSIEHLLLALAGVAGTPAQELLAKHGVTKEQLLAAIQDLAVILAEMCECAFVDLVLTEFGECLDIVPMELPGIGDQPEIPARKLFSILKGVSGAGDSFRPEEHARFTPRDDRSVPHYSYD